MMDMKKWVGKHDPNRPFADCDAALGFWRFTKGYSVLPKVWPGDTNPLPIKLWLRSPAP